mmetsp:Transcript_39099/g.90496  ORF Transcript_39099/g.90496 Transcript_39099/m.90496 type:complete len:214 (-) Transcript_39099:12-653(-)
MERTIFLCTTFTDRTLTLTSWPSLRTSSTFRMKSRLMCSIGTRPSPILPSSRETVTKAPKRAVAFTRPLCHWSGGKPTKGVKSTLSFFNLACTRAKSGCPLLNPATQTSRSSPSAKRSWGLATLPSAIRDMCSRPNSSAPMSTKAPYFSSLVTVPRYFTPTFSWSTGILAGLMCVGFTLTRSIPSSSMSHCTAKEPSLHTSSTTPGYHMQSGL